MIQDILPHLFSNQFDKDALICDDDYLFYFKKDALLLRKEGDELTIPSRKELGMHAGAGLFLFSLDGRHCYLLDDCNLPDDSAYTWSEINLFRSLRQQEIAWASIVAHQLMNWYQANRFCGKCGAPMLPRNDERAITCTGCENTVYPKISPAIIVAITCGENILLAKGINFRGGFYSLVAGYADVGESLEEAVAREVKEEVGLDVKNIRYYKSSPWPISGSLMIGFIAEADDQQIITIDPKEISHAAWFSRENLPPHPPASISIAGELIEMFKTGQLSKL